MTVWYDTTAVVGNGDVVLRTVVITTCVHVVLRRAAVCQWCCTNRINHGGHHCSLNIRNGGCWVSQTHKLLPLLVLAGKYSTAQNSTTQHSTTQPRTEQNTEQSRTAQHRTAQHNTAQHSPEQNRTLNRAEQHSTEQHNTTQHNTAQNRTEH
ncbi:hypothetical protein NFI96_034008 [Prochilodus magdalenae]|nr:hypothetical protein NFI96_034008 [Prochilodus magdalenae]